MPSDAKAAYYKFTMEFGLKAESLLALSKFAVLTGFSLAKHKKAIITKKAICPFRYSYIVEAISSENGDIYLKILKAKYSTGFYKWWLLIKAIKYMIISQTILYIAKLRKETWLNKTRGA